MIIKIEKVINEEDLEAFIAFPLPLCPGDPNWIPPLFTERSKYLSAKNPGMDHIIWQTWIAEKAGRIVGRITAQIDTLHRKRYGEDIGHSGMIDSIDNPQISAVLLDTTEAWLKLQGVSKINRPFSLNINRESGLLIEGFDTPPCAAMSRDKPWYAAHIEWLGYHKGIDLLMRRIQRTNLTFSLALRKPMDQVCRKVTIRCINRQRFAEDMQTPREVFSSGWQHSRGFMPFIEREFTTMGDRLKYLVPNDMIYIAEVDPTPRTFIVDLPNINEAIVNLDGLFFPLGWAKLL